MLNEFFCELKQSKYFENITGNHRVVLLYVAGSRLIDVSDEHSDYDLVAIVDEKVESEADEYLTYGDAKVHWYYIPLTSFICADGIRNLLSYGSVIFSQLTDEHIIYKNPRYHAVCQLLIDNKLVIAQNGVRQFYKRHKKLVQSIVQANAVLEENYTKILSHLCVTSYVALGEQLDQQAKDNLRQLKRIRWQPVDDSVKQWCVRRLSLLVRYVTRTNNKKINKPTRDS